MQNQTYKGGIDFKNKIIIDVNFNKNKLNVKHFKQFDCVAHVIKTNGTKLFLVVEQSKNQFKFTIRFIKNNHKFYDLDNAIIFSLGVFEYEIDFLNALKLLNNYILNDKI